MVGPGAVRKRRWMSFWKKHLSAFQRGAIRAACVDMWEPYRQSIEQWEQAKLLKNGAFELQDRCRNKELSNGCQG